MQSMRLILYELELPRAREGNIWENAAGEGAVLRYYKSAAGWVRLFFSMSFPSDMARAVPYELVKMDADLTIDESVEKR